MSDGKECECATSLKGGLCATKKCVYRREERGGPRPVGVPHARSVP